VLYAGAPRHMALRGKRAVGEREAASAPTRVGAAAVVGEARGERRERLAASAPSPQRKGQGPSDVVGGVRRSRRGGAAR
jgi:hypothetical protein